MFVEIAAPSPMTTAENRSTRFVRFAGTHEGQHVASELKAWVHDGDVVWWERRRILDSAGCVRGKVYHDAWWRSKACWLELVWGQYGLQSEQAQLQSLRACRVRAQLHDDSAQLGVAGLHDVPCLSSVGMLAFLLGASTSLKLKDVKSSCKGLLFVVLQQSLGSQFCSSLLEVGMPHHCTVDCQALPGQPCPHYQGVVVAAERQACDSTTKFVSSFWLLAAISDCAACKSLRSSWLQQCAAHLDSRLDELAFTSDPLKSTPLAVLNKRKRPIDEDFRRAVTSRVVSEGRCPSGSRYLKATSDSAPSNAGRWVDKDLLVHQAATWAFASKSYCCVVGLDAKRVGKPAENIEVSVATIHRPEGVCAAWLPPQVQSTRAAELRGEPWGHACPPQVESVSRFVLLPLWSGGMKEYPPCCFWDGCFGGVGLAPPLGLGQSAAPHPCSQTTPLHPHMVYARSFLGCVGCFGMLSRLQ